MNKWTLRIPGSSGNMGAGFDCFGLALGIYNEFSWMPADEYSLSFSGSVEIAADSRQLNKNYVVKAYKHACAFLDIAERPFAIHTEVNIPLRGGMGSSGTAIIAGCAAALLQKEEEAGGIEGIGETGKTEGAREASNKQLSYINNDLRHQILQLASELEKHPDNAAPSIYGGFVISTVAKEVRSYKFPVSAKIKCWIIMPQAEVSTSESRLSLPSDVPRQEAVFNISHGALTAVAFATQKYDLLKNAVMDKMHEAQRDNIYNYQALKQLLLNVGALSVSLSGSGPTMLVLVEELSEELKATANKHFNGVKIDYKETLMEVDNQGMTINCEALNK